MQDIVVTTNENIVKVSTIEKGEFNGVSTQVSRDIVKDYEIVNTEEYAQTLHELISAITKRGKHNLGLIFIVEPQEVVLKFISLSKGNANLEEQLIQEARAKISEISLDESYFTFLKVAPFVYQFVGIKKSSLEKYIDVSRKLGIGLTAVFPWTAFLPKFVGANDSSIFISKLGEDQVVALSEFGGIFFSGVYKKDKDTKELQKLVTDLSIYKRKNPISKIYVYNYEGFSLNPEYSVIPVEIPNSNAESAKGYELHLLSNHVLSKDPLLFDSRLNMLTYLPVPVIAKKKSVVPVILGSVLALLVLGAVIYFNKSEKTNELQQPQPEATIVEDTPKPENTEPPVPAPTTSEEVLNKKDLVFNVENGAGIAGIAGKTKTELEAKGYTVSSVGNSDEQSRTTTLVKIKASKNKYLPALKEDLKDKFNIEVEEDLPENSSFDVLLIVGSDAEV